MYKVLNSCGGTLREFPTFEEADQFCLWPIALIGELKKYSYVIYFISSRNSTHYFGMRPK